jgi:hypothetical protein
MERNPPRRTLLSANLPALPGRRAGQFFDCSQPYFASTDSVPDAVVGWHKHRETT